MTKGRFEVSYSESGIEKEIPGLAGKTMASAKVVHKGSEGHLTLRFTDGTVKVCSGPLNLDTPLRRGSVQGRGRT